MGIKLITEDELTNMWNYFLTLEQDISNTSRFVEPSTQENVFSFEFYKIIVLANTEVESAFKALSVLITGKEKGNIKEYREDILTKYPLGHL